MKFYFLKLGKMCFWGKDGRIQFVKFLEKVVKNDAEYCLRTILDRLRRLLSKGSDVFSLLESDSRARTMARSLSRIAID